MSAPAPHDDEFYIGYGPAMPPGIGGHLRRVCAAAALVILGAAVAALLAHGPLQPSRFDYGRPRPVSGTLARHPYPSLDVDGRRTWLVGPGKSGADALVAAVADGPVSLSGTPIARGRHAMLEVVPGTVRGVAGAAHPARPPLEAGREVTLRGEIVDSKCFLGVMNPGETTVHRDCARVCLRGGIPPMLLVRGAQGEEAVILLVSSSGQPVGMAVADLAGVPVEVRGRLTRAGDLLVLYADRAHVTVVRW